MMPPSATASSLTDHALKEAIDALQANVPTLAGSVSPASLSVEKERQQFVDRYLPLLSLRRPGDTVGPCWDEAQLTPRNLMPTLFWLDLMSVSEALSLATFDKDMQTLILEAALNPRRVRECAKKLNNEAETVARSLYLNEIQRNPEFIRFIARDLRPFELDITGAHLGSRSRFIQIRSGRKLHEGAAPDRASRLALVGELGVAVQVRDGLSTVVFGPEMNWVIE